MFDDLVSGLGQAQFYSIARVTFKVWISFSARAIVMLMVWVWGRFIVMFLI